MTPGTRRRGAELEAAIYDAALRLVAAHGYRELTMEGVAAAARTGKAALYRRWPSKAELVGDALLHALPDPPAPTAGGDLRAGLLELLTCYRDTMAACRGATFQILKDEESGLVHDIVHDRLIKPIKEGMYRVLREGAERGTVRPGADTGQMGDIGPAAVNYRMLTAGHLMSDEELRYLVDEVLLPAVSPRPSA
ncbi:TetR/AcrR family transcriptional regulator [Actinomadura parmotrematis]|uniref:TetR/AcrR family transcriptional regulator n=1 Tax=Actinomadura parmotrematis TaxID=2864039 RepID=A0ABS7FYJ2_9ACTN|nr:TetR/AcrR family transcriptional regulator [Actinomadura parmotrematis]MBW8485508.1 TetR/AcrR family transcriptional regulator [Actinomadura parmotrematis]